MNAAVELLDVHVYFGDYEILSGLSVAFPEGESTCIIGKAGSGKSTLLKTAAGLVVPDRGRVLYRGRDLARMNRAEELSFRKESSFAFQDAALWANQTIYNNLDLPLALHEPNLPKAESDRRIVEVARRAGYSEGLGFRPSDLSAGEQKLISLARALILDPGLLFMDEPTASLDEDSVDSLIRILVELKAAGKTLIVVTHDARLIARIADRLCVVAAGKVAGIGPAEQVAPLIGGELLKSIRAARSQFNSLDGGEGDA
jgi:phospholipid/cholesterol/gamma-HCH transport system ATP-binding protein